MKPWVLVAGMHRSGTSALAGTVAALGLGLPHGEDLMAGLPDNPVHNESALLTGFDERLLEAAGGSWRAPPPAVDWDALDDVETWRAEAEAAAERAFPGPEAVAWKDPRLCLLLPFWRRVLPPFPVVFVWRAPASVARSLGGRDGVSLAHGLSLWEHYNRGALEGMAGLEVLAVEYDTMLAAPAEFAETTAAWLDSVLPSGAPEGGWQVARAAEVPETVLRHEPDDAGAVLAGSQVELVEVLRSLGGVHTVFVPPALGASSPWVEGQLAAQRAAEGFERLAARLSATVDELRAGLSASEEEGRTLAERSGALEREMAAFEARIGALDDQLRDTHRRLAEALAGVEDGHAALEELRRSASWRVTRPLRAASALLQRALTPS